MGNSAEAGAPVIEKLESLLLTDEEVLALALGWTRNARSAERARGLLDRLGGLRALLASSSRDLEAAGVSHQPAERLLAVLELVRRRAAWVGERVRTPADVNALIADDVRFALEERTVLLSLDYRHRVVDLRTIAVGNARFTLVDPAQIFRVALLQRAAAVILVHNHPGGDPTPSVQDHGVTRRVDAVGLLIGIPLRDHVIVASGGFASFVQMGVLPPSTAVQAA